MPRIDKSKQHTAPKPALRLKKVTDEIKQQEQPKRITLEDAVAAMTKRKLSPSKLLPPQQFLEALCEHHSGMSGESWRALELIQAERFINADDTDTGTRALMALVAMRNSDIAVGKLVVDAAVASRTEQQHVEQVPDEELLKGLRLVAEQMVEQEALPLEQGEQQVVVDGEVLPLEGIG